MNSVEDTLRVAVKEWYSAFVAKDIDRLIALYAPEAVIYDAIPPFESGVETLRTKVIDCFPHFPDHCAVETGDITVNVGVEMATTHFLWHFTNLPPGHPAGRHWLRSTIVWREVSAKWRIVHDHCSAPFDPYTEKVVLSPEQTETGGESTAGCGTARNPVGWFEIYVDDMPRARAFYTAVLGLELTRLEAPVELWAFPMQPDGGGAAGALVKMPEAGRPAGNGVLVYFSCADCAVEAARAADAGGRIQQAKMSIGQYGFIAMMVDTEGNIIGLHSMQ